MTYIGRRAQVDGAAYSAKEFNGYQGQDLEQARGTAASGKNSGSIAGRRTMIKNPRIDTYWLDLDDCGPMVLDALIKIKSRYRLDADVPPVLPGRYLRVVLDEHRRDEHAGLPEGDRGCEVATCRSTRCRIWRW